MIECPFCTEIMEDDYLYNQMDHEEKAEVECPNCHEMIVVCAVISFDYYIEKTNSKKIMEMSLFMKEYYHNNNNDKKIIEMGDWTISELMIKYFRIKSDLNEKC